MTRVLSDHVEVYVFRRRSRAVEFLCLRRASGRSLAGVWQPVTGKRRRGESARRAAWREVVEETGVHARITGHADSIEYIDRRGRPKVVRYFMMEVVSDPGHRDPDDEVDIVAWWPIGYARTALTYPRDCDLLAGIGGPR